MEMKEFLLVFRGDYNNIPQGNPEEFKAMAKKWQDWRNKISKQGKWVAEGKQLNPAGKVVKSNGMITDGPYTETKEVLMSYCTIKAESIEDAVELSKDCPHLTVGGNVEIRELVVY
jgi:hypothetical protein